MPGVLAAEGKAHKVVGLVREIKALMAVQAPPLHLKQAAAVGAALAMLAVTVVALAEALVVQVQQTTLPDQVSPALVAAVAVLILLLLVPGALAAGVRVPPEVAPEPQQR